MPGRDLYCIHTLLFAFGTLVINVYLIVKSKLGCGMFDFRKSATHFYSLPFLDCDIVKLNQIMWLPYAFVPWDPGKQDQIVTFE